MKEKIICLVSGGIDSFVMVDFLKKRNFSLICVFVDYGQLSAKFEYKAFKRICNIEKISTRFKIRLDTFGLLIDSGLTKRGIYDDFFPSRNLILISLISSLLVQLNCHLISIGIINSSRNFPDCKREYMDDLEKIIYSSTKKKNKILTPLESFDKKDVLIYAEKYKLPIHLSYSCQKGIKNHCGKCPSCVERFTNINYQRRNKNNL